MMQFNQLTPNLMVEDVNRTIEYYQDILAFDLIATVPDSGTFDWAMMKRDGVTLMFQSRASLGEEIPELQSRDIGGSLTFYIDVSAVKSLYQALKEKTNLVQEFHTTFYGRDEFAISDCNGYILAFASEATK